MKTSLSMNLMNEKYGVCRLNAKENIPNWAYESDFFSITKTEVELSVLCNEEIIPSNLSTELDWRILVECCSLLKRIK